MFKILFICRTEENELHGTTFNVIFNVGSDQRTDKIGEILSNEQIRGTATPQRRQIEKCLSTKTRICPKVET